MALSKLYLWNTLRTDLLSVYFVINVMRDRFAVS